MAINGSPNGMTSNIYSDTPPPPIRHGVGKFEFIIGKSKVLKMSWIENCLRSNSIRAPKSVVTPRPKIMHQNAENRLSGTQKIVFQGRKKFPGGECPRTLLARYHYITYVYYAARNNLSENIVFRMSIEQYRIIKDHLDFATPTPPPPHTHTHTSSHSLYKKYVVAKY